MNDKKKYFTRMGDGSIVYMTEEEIRADIRAGVADAADRGKIPPLTEAEMDHIYDIVTMPGGVVGVDPKDAIVTSSDSGSDKISTKCGIPVDRSINAMIHERVLGADSVDIGLEDYNYKTVKGVAKREAAVLKNALNRTTMPLFYGAMPNLGFYTKPDGPIDNWAVLLPEGKIKEAMAAQEEAVDHAVRDIVFVAEQMYDVGADGIQLDTCGAAGDADFLAALKACEIIKEKFPGLGVEIGMAGEFVLGMHGRLKYNDVRLAGLYPHAQVKLVEQAGASIYGAVVNTNCNATFPWNIARVCTFLKACSEVAKIPVHANAGMGVCAIPMCENSPADIVSRVDKCLIEICKIDGL
jgi:dimethylamine--corrinoid protein Co-methyltransferase